MKLSLCMIVRDEESVLEQCLESVKSIVDEIIIVDTGSRDNTIKIAKKFTDQIKHFTWIDDFSAARNFATSFASYDFILTIDADEVLAPHSATFIAAQKCNNFAGADVISGLWHVELTHDLQPIKSMHKPLIFRRNAFVWRSPIHNELIALNPPIKEYFYAEIEIFHYKDRIAKAARYSQTLSIIERELKRDPKNLRLLFFYAESLFFEKRYAQAERIYVEFAQNYDSDEVRAVSACERLLQIYLSLGELSKPKELFDTFFAKLQNNPRFMLAYADAHAALELSQTKEYYKLYLAMKFDPSPQHSFYDIERYYNHPRRMLGIPLE